MTRLLSILLLAVPLVCFADTGNAPKDITPKMESAAFFKNGLLVVSQEADIPAEGIYRWSDVPNVIHGTFFVESDLNVEVRSTQQSMKIPVLDGKSAVSLADLNGTEVNVTFENKTSIRGEIITASETLSNSLLANEYLSSRDYYRFNPVAYGAGINSSLTLKLKDGRFVFLTGREIISLETIEPLTERTERKPVLLFNVKGNNGKTAGKIRLFYLVKGAAWSPSYRVNLLDGKKLTIEQTAQVRNEWLPIHDAEVSLVSGFPQLETAQVRSLLHPSQTLQQFFRQLNQPREQYHDFAANSMMAQQAILPSSNDPLNSDFDIAAAGAGEGPDIHYLSIGKRTLETGDTLSLTTGKGEADYRMVLECSVKTPSNRNNNQQKPLYEVFESVNFKNPLPFPMTTAPLTATEKGRFLAQSKSYWVNPSQTASVKLTKVMNVSVNYQEQFVDIPQEKEFYFLGRRYHQRSVTGTFTVRNQRNEEVALNLDTEFIGKEEKFDIEPQKQKVNTVSDGPNDSITLFWTLPLKSGETKTFNVAGKRWYSY